MPEITRRFLVPPSDATRCDECKNDRLNTIYCKAGYQQTTSYSRPPECIQAAWEAQQSVCPMCHGNKQARYCGMKTQTGTVFETEHEFMVQCPACHGTGKAGT
jgi:hypothetical protein